MENTAAASVDETIELSNMLSYILKSVIYHTNVPRVTAVSITPKVDKTSPSFKIGFTEFQLVSRPPENNIKFSETIPIN